jgi:acyl-CoA thioester hydrolase
MSASFEMTVPVLPGDIDEQKHVNNTVYLCWVQDVATAHWPAQKRKRPLAG